jgi:hypothetical protein
MKNPLLKKANNISLAKFLLSNELVGSYIASMAQHMELDAHILPCIWMKLSFVVW